VLRQWLVGGSSDELFHLLSFFLAGLGVAGLNALFLSRGWNEWQKGNGKARNNRRGNGFHAASPRGFDPDGHSISRAGFYKKFLLVKDGQKVRKGDVIAYVYMPPSSGDGCHIHFHVMFDGKQGFLTP
jgi:hypothetical protein